MAFSKYTIYFFIITLLFCIPQVLDAQDHEGTSNSESSGEEPPDRPDVYIEIPSTGTGAAAGQSYLVTCENDNSTTGQPVSVPFRITFKGSQSIEIESLPTSEGPSLAEDRENREPDAERTKNAREGSVPSYVRDVRSSDIDEGQQYSDKLLDQEISSDMHKDAKRILDMLHAIGYGTCGFGKRGPTHTGEKCCYSPCPELGWPLCPQ